MFNDLYAIIAIALFLGVYTAKRRLYSEMLAAGVLVAAAAAIVINILLFPQGLGPLSGLLGLFKIK